MKTPIGAKRNQMSVLCEVFLNIFIESIPFITISSSNKMYHF